MQSTEILALVASVIVGVKGRHARRVSPVLKPHNVTAALTLPTPETLTGDVYT